MSELNPFPPGHGHKHWEVEIHGQWHRVSSQALPDSIRSKKSVRFAYQGGIIDVAGPDGEVRRYRLVRTGSE